MDANLTQRRRSLEDKIPDIKKTLHMVEFLQETRVGRLPYRINVLVNCFQEGKQKADDDTDELDDEDTEVAKKPLTTTFELNDTLYAEAQLEDTDTVYLWLGVCFLSSVFPFPVDCVPAGKCHAIVQAPCSHIAIAIETWCRRSQSEGNYRGSRVPSRATHGNGGEHRKDV